MPPLPPPLVISAAVDEDDNDEVVAMADDCTAVNDCECLAAVDEEAESFEVDAVIVEAVAADLVKKSEDASFSNSSRATVIAF